MRFNERLLDLRLLKLSCRNIYVPCKNVYIFFCLMTNLNVSIIYSTSALIFIFDGLGGVFDVEVYSFNQILKSSATDFQGRKNVPGLLIYFFSQLITLYPHKDKILKNMFYFLFFNPFRSFNFDELRKI